jgi:hypothetical protein
VNPYLPKEFPRLKANEVLEKAHIIIGPNGQCMCGIYGERAVTCSQIIAEAFSKEEFGMNLDED